MIEEFLHLLPEPGILLTPGGEILAANPPAGELLGQSRSSLLRTNILQHIESGAASFVEFLHRGATTRTLLPGLFVWKRKDGPSIRMRCETGLLYPADENLRQEAVLYLRCRPHDEAVRRFAMLNQQIEALSREVDERRRAEESLRRSEERYRTLVAATSTAIWIADADGNFAGDQQAWEQFTGQRRAEYRGSGWLCAVHPDDRALVSEQWQASLSSGATLKVEVRLPQAGAGGYRRCRIQAVPVRAEKAIHEWVGTVTDIEEQKQFEEHIRQAQRLESLGILAGGVAHDFNNLLVGILGNASLALETLEEQSSARLLLERVIMSSEAAASLTRQMLAYAGKGSFAIGPLELSGLIRQISQLIQTSIPRTVQIRLDLAEGLPCIEADASQLQQVVMNLVINGAEAIGDRTGTVTVTTGLQQVDENYVRGVLDPPQVTPGRYVSLEVRDNGTGMDEETMARIFDPFFTTKFTGRGLGLAAVLGIVRGHQGSLKVVSTVGQGTTFRILLPASDSVNPEPVASERPAPVPGAGCVLVIDDEEGVRNAVKAMLEWYGYTVFVAENGQAGVDLLRLLAARIDVVLLDLTMPVMSGDDTLREMRAIDPDIAVILSSGYNDEEAGERFTDEAPTDFLQKPYSVAALVNKIRNVVAGRGRGKSGIQV